LSEGRRKKEEGRGLYIWIGTPTQNGSPVEVGVLNSLRKRIDKKTIKEV
jgi:hypothetical protein